MAKVNRSGKYDWDIFISYPRRPGILRWVADVFHPQIEEDLQNVGLRRPPRVFRDEQALEVGSIWPKQLSDKHASSRIVLAILCFPYFESAWCCSEWRTAGARGEYGTHGPIVPVRFNDLKKDTLQSLPPKWRNDVSKRKCLDLGEYSTLVDRLSNTELALRFRSKMAAFCEDVLKPAILAAPPQSPAWPRMPTQPIIRHRPAFRARLAR